MRSVGMSGVENFHGRNLKPVIDAHYSYAFVCRSAAVKAIVLVYGEGYIKAVVLQTRSIIG